MAKQRKQPKQRDDQRTYSPAQLARISGISVRALHHYDDIGLLVPARRDNGYRVYTKSDVARLQQILIFRSMGMSLADIAAIFDAPDYDAVAQLRSHLIDLRRQRNRMDALIANVERTINSLEGRQTMEDSERFEGLKREAIDKNERVYGAEARAKYGDKSIDEANAKLMAMTQQEYTDVMELGQAIKDQLVAARATGNPAGPEAQRLVEMHKAWLCAWWPEGMYTSEVHRSMAEMYLADKRFTAYYDEPCGAGATQFMHDAIYANA